MSGDSKSQQELISYVKKYKNIFGIDYDPIFTQNLQTFNSTIMEAAEINGLPAITAVPLTLAWMKEGLSQYIEELKKNNSQTQHDTDEFIAYFKTILEAFSFPSKTIKSQVKLSTYILRQIKDGKPAVIPSAYTGHSITFAIYKNKLICINRGRFILNNKEPDESWASVNNDAVSKDTSKEYGLWWTEINSEILGNDKKMRELINHLLQGIRFPDQLSGQQRIKVEEQNLMNRLMKLLSVVTLPDITKQDQPKVTINTLREHPVAKQKFRNCTWANKKPIILALLLFLCQEDNPKISLDTILREYKKCTTFLRVREIDNLIRDALNKKSKILQLAATQMLLAIIIKLTNKLSDESSNDSRTSELLNNIIRKLSECKLSETKRFYDVIFQQLPENIQVKLHLFKDSQDNTVKASAVDPNTDKDLMELLDEMLRTPGAEPTAGDKPITTLAPVNPLSNQGQERRAVRERSIRLNQHRLDYRLPRRDTTGIIRNGTRRNHR